VDVDVELGLGVLTIIVPPQVGAVVTYEKSWVSHVDCDDSFHATGENQYSTENFSTARGRMNIMIDSGMGSVKIRRGGSEPPEEERSPDEGR